MSKNKNQSQPDDTQQEDNKPEAGEQQEEVAGPAGDLDVEELTKKEKEAPTVSYQMESLKIDYNTTGASSDDDDSSTSTNDGAQSNISEYEEVEDEAELTSGKGKSSMMASDDDSNLGFANPNDSDDFLNEADYDPDEDWPYQ